MTAYVFMALLLAAAARPPIIDDRVEVELLGSGCEKVADTIYVVQNGDDQRAFPVKRVAPCTWHGPSREPFDLYRTSFSLRLSGARTQVHRPVEGMNHQSVARLQFLYAPASARNLRVKAVDSDEEWLNVGYIRHVWADASDDVEYDEWGKLTRGSAHNIVDVNLEAEQLRFRLPAARKDAPGLLVNPVLKKKKRAAFNGVSFVDELQRQAKRGTPANAPNDALAARKAAEQLVHDSRFKSLELAVP
jgi:hypothetical protein